MLSRHMKIFKHSINRRSFLMFSALVAGKCLLPRTAAATVDPAPVPQRSLRFCNLHSLETLETIYWKEGQYLEGALEEINYLFRDRRTQEIHAIDTGLLDLLHALKNHLKTGATFNLICGYRSPQTNAMLRKKSKAVAKKSFHLKGQAVDIRVPGLSTAALRKAAITLGGGGVGYYPSSGFVHMDVGPVRYW